jgi:WD40 repeat protein
MKPRALPIIAVAIIVAVALCLRLWSPSRPASGPGRPVAAVKSDVAGTVAIYAPGPLVTGIAYAPDSKRIAVASFDSLDENNIRGDGPVAPHLELRDAATGSVIRSYSGAWDILTSLAFSGDGTFMAGRVWSRDSHNDAAQILFWDVNGEKPRYTIDDRPGPPAIAFSRRGSRFVTARQQLKVWDHLPLDQLPAWVAEIGTPMAEDVSFSPSGNLLAWADVGGQVWTCDAKTGGGRRMLGKHKHGVVMTAFAGEQTLVSGGWGWSRGRAECEIIWWDVDRSTQTHRREAHTRITAIAASPDGRYVASAGGMVHGELILWDARSAESKWSMSEAFGRACGRVETVAFAPDGQHLAFSSAGGGVQVLPMSELVKH